MSQLDTTPDVPHAPGGARLHAHMAARSPHEAHRSATPLELFFDLVFVVAIAQAGSALHHAISADHAMQGVAGYLMVFFAIWWAWMNYTWFASAYDCDDVPYRLAVFVQMAGALILAAGVRSMFEAETGSLVVIGGYVVMRLSAVAQWLRAARADPAHRSAARRYALGLALLQLVWISVPLFPRWWIPAFLTFCALELALPVWAERATPTTWHPHHIAERYGLLTLIVLGESILAATIAIQTIFNAGEWHSGLVPLVIGGLLIVYSMWWVYFDRPVHDLIRGNFRKAMVWGYGHYVVFAAAAAVGAGLAVSVDHATGHTTIGATAAGAAVAIPVAVYYMCLWFLHDRPEYRRTRAMGPAAAALVLLTPFTGHAVLLTGLILASLVAVKFVVLNRP
jgi:low temperature requirement protein LtrA